MKPKCCQSAIFTYCHQVLVHLFNKKSTRSCSSLRKSPRVRPPVSHRLTSSSPRRALFFRRQQGGSLPLRSRNWRREVLPRHQKNLPDLLSRACLPGRSTHPLARLPPSLIASERPSFLLPVAPPRMSTGSQSFPSLLRTPLPPSCVDHCVQGRFVSPDETALVTAGANVIRVFRIRPQDKPGEEGPCSRAGEGGDY